MTSISPTPERVVGRRLEEVSGPTLLQRIQRRMHAHPLIGPVAVLAIACIGFSIWVGPKFFGPRNISLLLQQVQIVGAVGIAQTLVVLTGGIDLSVAAIMVFTSIIAGTLVAQAGVPAVLALLIALACGALCGGLNGLLVTRFRIPPFIATLGTMSIFTALNLQVSGSQTIRTAEVPDLLLWPGDTFTVLGTPVTYGSLLTIAGFVVAAFVLRRTAFGEHVYAAGDNPEGARLSGIHTSRVLIAVYVAAGVICAIAGWLLIGRVGSISPFSGTDVNLTSITAVVIGGTSLFGGRGSVTGTLLGALIVGVFSNGLTLAGVDVLWQVFTTGVLVILAVAVDQWTRRIAG
jgi:fructose transport system permease protein